MCFHYNMLSSMNMLYYYEYVFQSYSNMSIDNSVKAY